MTNSPAPHPPGKKARKLTPAARALVGALALDGDATINAAFVLAGYSLKAASPVGGTETSRLVVRSGRIVAVTINAGHAAHWLRRVGARIEGRSVSRRAA